MISIEAKFHLMKRNEAAHEQSGTSEQDQRKCHLASDQQVS